MVLSSNFDIGDPVVDFNVSILSSPGGVLDYRDSAVVVETVAGDTCTWPTIGSILDDNCSGDDECQPDLAIAFPFTTETPGIASINMSSLVPLVSPTYSYMLPLNSMDLALKSTVIRVMSILP